MSVKQNGVFTLVITSVTPIRTLRTQPTLVAEQVTAHFVNPRLAARAHRTAAEDACLFRAVTGERKSTCIQVIIFISCVCGAMASSAVSSVLYLRDAAGNHAEMRTSAHIYFGDAASFHEWEFRTRLRIAGKSGVQHIEAMSKVCDGLRGDAFAAAQEVGFENQCEIIDGRPCGIDTVINQMRRTVLPSTEHESKELFRQYCRPRGPPVQTKWRKYETVCLATTTLLDTPDSDGPSNTPQ